MQIVGRLKMNAHSHSFKLPVRSNQLVRSNRRFAQNSLFVQTQTKKTNLWIFWLAAVQSAVQVWLGSDVVGK